MMLKNQKKLYECSEDGGDMKREKQSSGQNVVRRSAKYKIIIIVQYSAAITWYSKVTYVNRFVASMYNCTLLKIKLFTETLSSGFPFNRVSTVNGRPRSEK